MAKINQIQTRLKELDGAVFQKLADAYLHRKGYSQINSIGSVAGKNKVKKGTPDTFIPTSEGKYVFAEYTTIAPDELFDKISGDISKCLNEAKTGIAVSKIAEIVVCYNSELTPESVDKLRHQCESVGVNLNLYGLSAVSYDLLQKYPNLSRDYLGIEVDSGQIVNIDDFISLYETSKLATTLKTAFHFRNKERDSILTAISGNDIVIVSGSAGVGKSRTAIECYRQYLQSNDFYKAYCIFNRGIDLYEDIRSYFSDAGSYLIFVDDANRISGFQYIVQLVQTKRSDQTFKVIVTVRDYALDKIKDMCATIKLIADISLKPFTDKEIEQIVRDEFEIKNYLYLERIVSIAHGNTRLAVMAAQVAKDNNKLASIRDVSDLYDNYYSTIKKDLDSLGDKKTLKIAAIVAFFRIVDRSSKELMSEIEGLFEFNAEEFWEVARKLHDMEVFDMYEDEVVKVADQVLATYLFHLVVFKQQDIDFAILLSDGLFPKYKQRIIDAINPVLNAFDFDMTKQFMQNSVDEVWSAARENNKVKFIELIKVFWFLKPTETLMYIQDEIEMIDTKTMLISDVIFEKDTRSDLPQILSILSRFRFLGADEVKMSIDLLLRYAEKRPDDTSAIVSCFDEKYGFQSNSYLNGYAVQHAVIDKIIKYSNSGKNEYFSTLFIVMAKKYLLTEYSRASSGRGDTITISRFTLSESPDLRQLRNKILLTLFELYSTGLFQNNVLKLLLFYMSSGFYLSVRSIIENDAELLSPFLINTLEPSNLFHCIVVQKYSAFLKRHSIQTTSDSVDLFRSKSYLLYDLLTNKLEKAMLKLDTSAYREYLFNRIAEFTASFSAQDYDKMLHEIHGIQKELNGHNKWQIGQGVVAVLEELSIRIPDLFEKVISDYLQQGDYLGVDSSIIVHRLVKTCGSLRAISIISFPNYKAKERWLFSYYQNLSIDDIKPHHIDTLLSLYNKVECKYIIADVDYLLKYESLQSGFVVNVVKTILRRSEEEEDCSLALSLMFNPHTEINKLLISLFSDNIAVLENAYFAIDRSEARSDYDGTSFSAILDRDSRFIDKYLDYRFSSNDCISKYDDSRNYSFVWRRDDYYNVMQQITNIVHKYTKEGRCYSYYNIFYKINDDSRKDLFIRKRQDDFLLSLIRKRFSELEFISFVFIVIVEFETERKLPFYEEYLRVNHNFDHFKEIPLEPMTESRSGSAVPMLQGKITFYENLVELCNTVNLLKHRQFLETRIKQIRAQIQNEKKKDFTENS